MATTVYLLGISVNIRVYSSEEKIDFGFTSVNIYFSVQ